MTDPHNHDRLVVEVPDDAMVEVLRQKSGAERLAISFGMYRMARRMLLAAVRQNHPDWDDQRVQREVARRLSHGAV